MAAVHLTFDYPLYIVKASTLLGLHCEWRPGPLQRSQMCVENLAVTNSDSAHVRKAQETRMLGETSSRKPALCLRLRFTQGSRRLSSLTRNRRDQVLNSKLYRAGGLNNSENERHRTKKEGDLASGRPMSLRSLSRAQPSPGSW
jgi:hypothetical protein